MTIYTEAQTNREILPQLVLESVSRGDWHRVAQHFEDAAKCTAKAPGRPIIKPLGDNFQAYLGLGLCGLDVCVSALSSYQQVTSQTIDGRPAAFFQVDGHDSDRRGYCYHNVATHTKTKIHQLDQTGLRIGLPGSLALHCAAF
jgi:hypothetical protein